MPHLKSVKRITHLQLIFICCLIFYWIHHVSGIYETRRFSDRSRILCENPEPLPNGFSALRRRNMMLLHYCNNGFKLFGDRRTTCNRGKWVGNRPICASQSNFCSLLFFTIIDKMCEILEHFCSIGALAHIFLSQSPNKWHN